MMNLSIYCLTKILRYLPSEKKILSFALVSQLFYETIQEIIKNTPRVNNRKQLKEACIKSRYIRIYNLIKFRNGGHWRNLDKNYGLSGACISGDWFLIHLMIKHGARAWNKAVIGACQGDHLRRLLFLTI